MILNVYHLPRKKYQAVPGVFLKDSITTPIQMKHEERYAVSIDTIENHENCNFAAPKLVIHYPDFDFKNQPLILFAFILIVNI